MSNDKDKTIILESERNQVIEDHNYDGILELNRAMPWWLTAIFMVTVSVGTIYMLHKSTTDLSQEEYLKNEMAQIKKRQENVPQAAIANISEDSLQQTGKVAYLSKCAACHGANGEGVIGPNLTDEYWIHGQGKKDDIQKTINEGVLDKGMPAWSQTLTPTEVIALTSFVQSIAGTNAPNGKAPQGEKYGLSR